MLDRNGLYKAIKNEVQKRFMDRKWLSGICKNIFQKYDIPPEITSDLLNQKTDIQDIPDAILFCIAKEFNLTHYFTKTEQDLYESYKYEAKSVKFPYTFDDMVEISEGKQYIGKITVQQLMELRDAQILNYNANTQRQMQLKTGNNFSYFRIALNRKAVEQITSLLKANDFISNTITLNINPETDYIYSNGKLKIREEAKFDILDGYHRYIAMSNLYNLDKSFDYTMELRVTFFREEIARQFIFQEDQKTKLAKVDSESMDKNSISNKVCRELLDMLKDKFNAVDIIRPGTLSKILSILYIDRNKSYSYAKINAIAGQIFKAIKDACLDVPDLLEKPWTDQFTVMFLVMIKSGEPEAYEKAMKISKNITTTELKINTISVTKLNKLLLKKGGENYVIQ